MSAAWYINDVLLATRGIKDLSLSLRLQAASQMSFNVTEAFDAVPQFSYNDPVVLKRDSLIVFQGRVDPVSRVASASAEAHDFYVVDAWQQLEDTIYQESWPVGNIVGGVLFPRAVLGLDTAGDPISTGGQIAAVIAYAASVGVDLQAGTIEAGDVLWPEEVKNVSCAEVIRLSLQFHPDHVPWIDYATSPPTLHVTKRADMTPVSINVDGTGDATLLRYRRRDDILPLSVRLIYETAQNIDGEIYRDGVIDKYPSAGPDGGPRCLIACIELSGMQMQFAKSPVQVRALPDDQATAKAYLRIKFPHLAGVADADFNVTEWTKTLVPEAEGGAHVATRINPNAVRLQAETLEHLPNELVRGNIADWMRVRVGKVHVAFAIEPTVTAAGAALTALQKPLPPGFTVVATNAETKIYHGLTQWETGENAPAGLAQAIYQSLTAAYEHDGAVSLAAEDVGTTRYLGTCINLTGSADTATATMKSIVHSVDMTIATGETTVEFGPAPHLAPADIIELQRRIRRRAVTWWSKKERTSNRLGVDDKPGSKGDTVSPYDIPETVFDATAAGSGYGGAFFETVLDAGDTYLIGGQIIAAEVDAGVGSIANRLVLDGGSLPSGITAGDLLWLEVTAEAITDDADEIMISGLHVTAAAWDTGASLPPSSFPSISAAGTIILEVGRWTATEFIPYAAGGFNLGGCNGNLNIQRF